MTRLQSDIWVDPTMDELNPLIGKSAFEANRKRITRYCELGLHFIVYGEGKVSLFRNSEAVGITLRRCVLKNFNGICPKCGKSGIPIKKKHHMDYMDENGKLFHVDHIVPVSKGGTRYISNLQVLCPDCNKHKWENDSG
jgi:hypothetical protein